MGAISCGPQGRESPLALRLSKKFASLFLIASSMVIDLSLVSPFVLSEVEVEIDVEVEGSTSSRLSSRSSLTVVWFTSMIVLLIMLASGGVK